MITKSFSVTVSVFAEIYQPGVLESAFLVLLKLNCSSRIERSGTCKDLNKPEVDCMNWRTRSVKKGRGKVNVLFLVSRLHPKLVYRKTANEFCITWSRHDATTDSALSLGPSTGD